MRHKWCLLKDKLQMNQKSETGPEATKIDCNKNFESFAIFRISLLWIIQSGNEQDNFKIYFSGIGAS